MDTQWTIAITEALDLIGGGEVARFSVKGSQSSCRLTHLWFLPFCIPLLQIMTANIRAEPHTGAVKVKDMSEVVARNRAV